MLKIKIHFRILNFKCLHCKISSLFLNVQGRYSPNLTPYLSLNVNVKYVNETRIVTKSYNCV